MHIFNTYTTLNLKETIYSINKAYIWIHHYALYHYKCSENFTPYWNRMPSNKTKMAKFALFSSIKQLPWHLDIQLLLEFLLWHVGLIDVFMCGFNAVSINNKVKKNQHFFIKLITKRVNIRVNIKNTASLFP